MGTNASTSKAVESELRKLCAKLPDSEEYVMVHHPAFRVGKKPFAIVGMQSDGKRATVSVNLGTDEQAVLLADDRFVRTPYIGQHGWVTVARKDVSAAEFRVLVQDSWRRVAGKRRAAAFDAAS